MQTHPIRFPNSEGHTLSARLDLPVDSPPRAYALFAHCFTCTKNIKAMFHISRVLTRERIAVLRFDFTGLGESEGEFADTNFSSTVEDISAAARYLESTYSPPRILIGHSMGGAAVLQAAATIAAAAAVVTIGAPSEPAHIAHRLGDQKEQILRKGEAWVDLAGRKFKIKKQFLDDLSKTRMQETIRNLNRPLLIMHAPLDRIVGIEHAGRIFQAARHPKSFLSLDRADHMLSNAEDSDYAGALIAAWARKYLGTP